MWTNLSEKMTIFFTVMNPRKCVILTSDVNSHHEDSGRLAPRTGKFIKNGLGGSVTGENLLQNGILHFVFTLLYLR